MVSCKSSTRRLRSWAGRVLIALALLATITLSVLYGLARTAGSQWEQLAAEIRECGEPLTFEEIEAYRAASRVDARPQLSIHHAIEELAEIDEPDEADVLFFDRRCRLDFFRGITTDCIEPTRRFVTARRDALDLLHTPAVDGKPALNISYSGTTSELTQRILKVASPLRALGRLGNAQLLLHIIDNNSSAAVETVKAQFRLTEALYAEPQLLFFLVAIATDAQTARTIEGILNTLEIDADELAILQDAFMHHGKSQTIKWALLGERAATLNFTDSGYLIAEASGVAWYDADTGERVAPFNPVSAIPFLEDWLLNEYRVGAVAVFSKFVRSADDLQQLLALEQEEDTAIRSRWHAKNQLLRTLLPNLGHSFELYARNHAILRSILAAIAAERYRLVHDRFPESLDDLVPDFLAEVPLDPFDGAPLRLIHNNQGIVIYSIGENRTDDGGSILWTQGQRRPTDAGARLLKPSLRQIKLVARDDSD